MKKKEEMGSIRMEIDKKKSRGNIKSRRNNKRQINRIIKEIKKRERCQGKKKQKLRYAKSQNKGKLYLKLLKKILTEEGIIKKKWNGKRQ